MKALITGYRGFIGRHLTSALERRGYDILGIDLKDGFDCRWFFRSCDAKFDLVVHLAALVGGRATIEGNPLSVATNLSLDSEMFAWAMETHQPRVMYFSSSAAYPANLQIPERKLRESDIDLNGPLGIPDQTYGWAKLSGEIIAKTAREEGLKIHIVRPFSSYGFDQDLDYPMPAFIARAKAREDPFVIWGTGEQVRDYIWIEDLIEVVLRMITEDIEGPLNIGSGIPVNFWDLARVVTDAFDYAPKITPDLSKPQGVPYRCGDVSRMLEIYKPKIALREGVRLLCGQ